MAFGGYKFKGYKVVRANLATNTYANWCLLVHQARIKAFMESCALSGAQWHFSKTNGALSLSQFEDSGPFGTWPALALNVSSQKSSSGITSSSFPVTSEGAFTSSSQYFGCATKGKDIITFFGKNQNRCCIESGDAFSALCDPDDDYTIAKIILGFNVGGDNFNGYWIPACLRRDCIGDMQD